MTTAGSGLGMVSAARCRAIFLGSITISSHLKQE